MEADWDVMESDDEGAWGIPTQERQLARTCLAGPSAGLDHPVPVPFQARWGPFCGAGARFFTLRMYTPDKRAYNV
eukprot:5681789-Prorocentrum_lima.AAC.1